MSTSKQDDGSFVHLNKVNLEGFKELTKGRGPTFLISLVGGADDLDAEPALTQEDARAEFQELLDSQFGTGNATT